MSESDGVKLNVVISPEDIQRQIVDAISKSAIGDELHKVVKEEAERISRSFDNPLKGVVTTLVHAELTRIVREDFKDQIEKAVREALTPQFINDLVSALFAAWHEKIERFR